MLPAIVVMGLLLTALGTWAAVQADRSTEKRLLAGQTRQAAAVLSTAIAALQQPLDEGLAAERLVPHDRAATAFNTVMRSHVGPQANFDTASLWRLEGGTFHQVQSVGSDAAAREGDPGTDAFLRHAVDTKGFVVRLVTAKGQPRISYASADPGAGLVVYAERAVPADRRARVDRDSAFADIDYAIYLGTTSSTSSMLTTNVDPASLPMTGRTSQASAKFGDTQLILVTSAHDHLGSAVSRRLPWIILLVGLLLTATSWAVARKLVRARQRAEQDTRTITDLYQRVDTLFGEQRVLAEGLQRSLLPQATPDIPGIEVAAEYVAGAQGVDIGGDWYSIIGVDEDEFAFVVGDVSGNGIDAVAEMARARFTLRAYLVDGNSPRTALEKCSRQFDVLTDGHIVTVLAGVGNRQTGEIVLASAGHPPPLLVTGADADFLTMPVGPPLGAGACSYRSTTMTMPEESTLLAYTDGLIERRESDLSSGMARLAATVRRVHSESLQSLVRDVLESMRGDGVSDDIAVLALRRRRR